MNEKAATDEELLQSFAEEAKRRCDVIAAGLATATTDFETMRAEAHALKGTASVVGLRRLAFQLHAELGKERLGGLEVVDDDENVVHPLNRHIPGT